MKQVCRVLVYCLFSVISKYGPVRGVQIPRREKRMFGFVSFYHPETAQLILAMGQPHLICGYWVLAKPYVEKSKLTDRSVSMITLLDLSLLS